MTDSHGLLARYRAESLSMGCSRMAGFCATLPFVSFSIATPGRGARPCRNGLPAEPPHRNARNMI